MTGLGCMGNSPRIVGIVVPHSDTPREHAGMLSLYGGTKILEGSTIVLVDNP